MSPHAYLNSTGRHSHPAVPCMKAHFDSRRHALKFINEMRKNNGGISAAERPGSLYPYRCTLCPRSPWHVGHTPRKRKSL